MDKSVDAIGWILIVLVAIIGISGIFVFLKFLRDDVGRPAAIVSGIGFIALTLFLIYIL